MRSVHVRLCFFPFVLLSLFVFSVTLSGGSVVEVQQWMLARLITCCLQCMYAEGLHACTHLIISFHFNIVRLSTHISLNIIISVNLLNARSLLD